MNSSRAQILGDPVRRNQLIKALGPDEYRKWSGLYTLSKRRMRASRYAAEFAEYHADVLAEGLEPKSSESYFEEIRSMLANHCDRKFTKLDFAKALKVLKPARGPVGGDGVAARWSAACGAFGDTEPSPKKFRQPRRDLRRPG